MATWRLPVFLTWAGTGSPGVNVFHFRGDDGDPLSGDVQEASEALQAMYAGLANNLPNSMVVSMDGDVIKDPYGSPEYGSVTPWSVTGTGGPDFLPTATAIVIGWRTTAATRSGRGRTFIGPLAPGVLQADGTPNTDALNDFRLAGTNLVNTSQGYVNSAFGVYSPTDNVIRDFQGSSVRDTFAVLRSRRD